VRTLAGLLLAAWFAASPAFAAAPTPTPTASLFTKAPYLQAPEATRMMILWESWDDRPAVVRYGEGRRLDQVALVAPPRAMAGTSPRSRTNLVSGIKTNVTSYAITNAFFVYEAPLEGLKPDTAYSYVVELGGQRSAVSRIRTFGTDPAEVRFIAYGDTRSNPQTHAAVARHFLRHKPDFILHTGDLVARGRDYSLWSREFFDPLRGIIDHVPVLPAIGNHEDDGTNYFAYFHLPQPERWYSFDLGPVHVLALDFHFESRTNEQFQFARQDLLASQAPWKLVFLHVPMFNIGGHASTWGHEAYLPLFHETKVDLVIAGHSHMYERFLPVAPKSGTNAWPVIHITTGGGGATLYPTYDHPALARAVSTNHYVVFEATDRRLRGQAVLPTGRSLDTFELHKDPRTREHATRLETYPEETLKAYFEAAPSLRGVADQLPSSNAPVRVTFTPQPAVHAPGPVEVEVRIAADCAKDYAWVGEPLRFMLPPAGEAGTPVEARVRATGRSVIAAKPGANLSPPLVFEGRLRSREIDMVARGTRSILSAKSPTNAPVAPTNAAVAPPSQEPAPQIALADSFPPERLKTFLIPRAEYHPFATATNRAAWEKLPEKARLALVQQGEEALAKGIPNLPATLYLQYAREGNRSRYESVYFERRRLLHRLALAECAEAKGRFLDGIGNVLWALCEESTWCIPAHVGAQKAGVGLPDVNEPIVDLFAAQTAVSVAWTLYLVGPELDRVSPRVRRRASQEVQRRILSPVMDRDFGWMGFGSKSRSSRPNNWNPWINASVLTAALTLEEDEDRRVQLVHRILRSLDRFLQPYPEDGGCDEGPGYWARAGGSVLDSLDLLAGATRGQLDVFKHPLIGEIGRFIHRAHIADDWFVDIGDCSAKSGIERELVFRYGRLIQDTQLQAMATSGATLDALVRSLDSIDLGRALCALRELDAILAGSGARMPYARDSWLGSDEMQMMMARDREDSTDGFFVAAWGGHNAQSHNHNDVGNCLVFVDGQPVLVDLGAPTYTAKTFSSRRYEIPAMQSSYHNLPAINGVQQAAGQNYAARDVQRTVSDARATLRMDIAGAWPKDAAVKSWVREVDLERGRAVTITEAFDLKEVRGATTLNWMTPLQVRLDGPGRVLMPLPQGAAAVEFTFDPASLEAELEPLDLDDDRLEKVWGKRMTRIVLRPKKQANRGTWTVRLSRAPASQ
jgi:predicted phosphodiesterase